MIHSTVSIAKIERIHSCFSILVSYLELASEVGKLDLKARRISDFSPRGMQTLHRTYDSKLAQFFLGLALHEEMK